MPLMMHARDGAPLHGAIHPKSVWSRRFVASAQSSRGTRQRKKLRSLHTRMMATPRDASKCATSPKPSPPPSQPQPQPQPQQLLAQLVATPMARSSQGAVSQLRVEQETRVKSIDQWGKCCEEESQEARIDARRFEQQLQAALQSTAHLGTPNAFRTAIGCDMLAQISAKHPRFKTVMDIIQKEVLRAVYVRPPEPAARPARAADAVDEREASSKVTGNIETAARLEMLFKARTYFTELKQVVHAEEKLEADLDNLDTQHALRTKQLRNQERMVDTIARRWAHILLRQSLINWRKIVIRKKYTRVLLEKTSGRWAKQGQLRLFRKWADTAKQGKETKIRDMVQNCVDQTREMDELLARMGTQIENTKIEMKGHREHYDFAKRQILSLEELLEQLDTRVHSSNERKLQVVANEWGRMCLAFVDCQAQYLQNMLDAVKFENYADASVLVIKGEELSDLVDLPSDVLVLRWINHQLLKCATATSSTLATFGYYQSTQAGFIQNFTSDMRNNYVLRHILHRVINQKKEVGNYSLRGIPSGDRRSSQDSTILSARNKVCRGSMIAEPTPFATRDEVRSALEEVLDPPCPSFLSSQVLEANMPSDLSFCLFSFLFCEHSTLVPLPPIADCPWKEAQLALDEAIELWDTIRGKWTELKTPFEVREVPRTTLDLTSPPHLLVRANIALQNAVNTVQYACSKRSIMMKVWGCLQRKVQQDAMRLLLRRGRMELPMDVLDRRLLREKYMLTTLHIAKLGQAFRSDETASVAVHHENVCKNDGDWETEFHNIEAALEDHFCALRRVYRYYASIDSELELRDHVLRQQSKSIPQSPSSTSNRAAFEEERFFRKISISMSLVEFHVFLKDCRVFGSTRPFPYAFIQRVFEQVNIDVAATADTATVLTTKNLMTMPLNDLPRSEIDARDGNGATSDSEMTPAEFVEALVHIARSPYVRFKQHPSTTVNGAAPLLSLSERFRRLLSEIVLPNAMQEREHTNVFHQQLLAPECREVFTKYQRKLHTIYLAFAALEHGLLPDLWPRSKNASTDKTSASSLHNKQPIRRMLSINGFVAMLKACNLLWEHFLILDDVNHIVAEILQLDRSSVHINLDVVTACVDAYHARNTQTSDGIRIANAGTGSITGNQEEPLFLTYAEFLEAIAAVVCYLRPNAFVPLAKKLDEFFNEELKLDHVS